MFSSRSMVTGTSDTTVADVTTSGFQRFDGATHTTVADVTRITGESVAFEAGLMG